MTLPVNNYICLAKIGITKILNPNSLNPDLLLLTISKLPIDIITKYANISALRLWDGTDRKKLLSLTQQ